MDIREFAKVNFMVPLVQLVRTPRCGRGGPQFESEMVPVYNKAFCEFLTQHRGDRPERENINIAAPA